MTKTGKHLSGRVARALDVSHIYKKQRPGASAGFLSPQTEQGNNMTERILTAVRALTKGMVAKPVDVIAIMRKEQRKRKIMRTA